MPLASVEFITFSTSKAEARRYLFLVAANKVSDFSNALCSHTQLFKIQ